MPKMRLLLQCFVEKSFIAVIGPFIGRPPALTEAPPNSTSERNDQSGDVPFARNSSILSE
jgi:hypothetical protein